MAYQKVIIVGNLGRDPEMRYTAEGVPVVTFSVATNRVTNTQEGAQSKETTWFRVTCWRRTAEIASQFLTKGRQVMIEGRLQPDKDTGGPRIWTDQSGASRASYELVAERLVLLGGRAEGAPGAPEGGAQGPDYGAEEDIPF